MSCCTCSYYLYAHFSPGCSLMWRTREYSCGGRDTTACSPTTCLSGTEWTCSRGSSAWWTTETTTRPTSWAARRKGAIVRLSWGTRPCASPVTPESRYYANNSLHTLRRNIAERCAPRCGSRTAAKLPSLLRLIVNLSRVAIIHRADRQLDENTFIASPCNPFLIKFCCCKYCS